MEDEGEGILVEEDFGGDELLCSNKVQEPFDDRSVKREQVLFFPACEMILQFNNCSF